MISEPDAVALWRQADHCPDPPRHHVLPPVDQQTSVGVDTYQPCASGTAVSFYTVTDGGDTGPGGPQYLPRPVIGATTCAFSATEQSWAFFTAHPRG